MCVACGVAILQRAILRWRVRDGRLQKATRYPWRSSEEIFDYIILDEAGISRARCSQNGPTSSTLSRVGHVSLWSSKLVMGCMRCRSGEPRYRAGRGVCGACKWAPCARDAVPWALRSHGTTRLLAAVGYFIAVGWVGDKVQYVTGVRSREADRQCGERPLPDLLLSVLPNAAGTGMLNVVSFAVVAMAFSWAWVPRRGERNV